MKTFERIERGAYVVIGAADLVAEKVRRTSGIERLRETPVIDQIRDIEPTLRRSATELSERGEKVMEKVAARAEVTRASVETLPVAARRTLEGLRDDARRLRHDPKAQWEQIRTVVSDRVGQLRTRNGSQRARNDQAA